MAFDNNYGVPPVAKYSQESLTYNPFASDWQDEESGNSATTQVAQRRDPNYGIHADPIITTSTQLSSSSRRIQDIPTHDSPQNGLYDFSHDETGHLHPLRGAGMKVGSSDDAGITRPHLSRIVNVGSLVDVPPIERDGNRRFASRPEETNVLVHEVEFGDSLAGVALKYGISMTELRRANHLWSSDSIHLRKQLYIPVEKATLRQKDGILISISPAEEQSNPLEDFGGSMEQSSASNDSPLLAAGTIRRIPASHLSFFPPASRTTSGLQVRSSPYTHQYTSSHKPYSNHGRYTSSPSHSLTSILTALPIAASTRDTIIARLSFDSVSSSYSDHEQINDHHEGLELDDVQHASSSHNTTRNYIADESSLGYTLPTPTARFREPRSDGSSTKSQPPSPTHVRTLSSSPHSYIPPHAQVRTIQLEPSPGMQLPPSKGPRQETKKRTSDTTLIAELTSEATP